MPPRERAVERGARRGRHARQELGRELREARLAAGLTQAALGQAVRLSASTVSRVEAGLASQVTIDRMARLLALVGMDLSVRAYPAGPPIRDAAHVALLTRFRERVGPVWRWVSEVPIDLPGDQRAWDGHLIGTGLRIGVDAETRLRDIQALVRREELKRRDSRVDRVILVVAATRTNRDALRAAARLLAEQFPASGRAALAALVVGRDPGGDAVIVL
jgi:transcriptional regulator with XRE-family HTH domain